MLNILYDATIILAQQSTDVNQNGFEVLLDVIIALVSGGLGVLLTHIFYKAKLKKEQKVRFENVIGDHIASSLLLIRDLELECQSMEIYNIHKLLNDEDANINLFGDLCQYLSIFNDWNCYKEYLNKIHEVRHKYEKYADCEVTLYLVFIEKYLYQLGLYLSEYDEKLLPAFGAIFSGDIISWQREFDKVLIRKINSNRCKIESHFTLKYKRKRRKIIDKRWKKTLLGLIKTGYAKKKKDKVVLEMINIFFKQIKRNPDKFIEK